VTLWGETVCYRSGRVLGSIGPRAVDTRSRSRVNFARSQDPGVGKTSRAPRAHNREQERLKVANWQTLLAELTVAGDSADREIESERDATVVRIGVVRPRVLAACRLVALPLDGAEALRVKMTGRRSISSKFVESIT
jgi:hypothetical protein